MNSVVSKISPADSSTTEAHYARKLALETDCWDVNEAMAKGADFVLLDVRSPAAYAKGHVPGAANLPHANISEDSISEYASESLFVVYCAGPHCNGADRAALRLAKLRRPVKIMIGGVTGWIDEGFNLERLSDTGS
jgi:rhodanese-related sulfurtransferase